MAGQGIWLAGLGLALSGLLDVAVVDFCSVDGYK